MWLCVIGQCGTALCVNVKLLSFRYKSVNMALFRRSKWHCVMCQNSKVLFVSMALIYVSICYCVMSQSGTVVLVSLTLMCQYGNVLCVNVTTVLCRNVTIYTYDNVYTIVCVSMAQCQCGYVTRSIPRSSDS